MLPGTIRVFLASLAATCCFAAQSVSVPFYFEQNRGQFDPAIQYIARDPSSLRIFKSQEVLWQPGDSTGGLRMAFENPARASVIEGLDALSGKVNYLLGNPQNSIRNVDCYSRIRYSGIFPGVNVDFRHSSGALEYDVILSPGADPASVRFLFSGARNARLTDSGDLVFETQAGTIRHRAPVSWQLIGGERRPVIARFTLQRNGSNTEVGFLVDSWDRRLPLTIDPIVTYDQTLGGSGTFNNIAQIQVDGQGNVFVAGVTNSLDLPVTTGPQPVPVTTGPPSFQSFAAKLRADGSGFVYITYFLAGANFQVTSLAIDAAGDTWMAGNTPSLNFPVTQNAVQKAPYPGLLGFVTQTDGFIFGLDPSGSTQIYGSYLGGSGNDSIGGMAAGPDGTIWIAGTTASTDFPVTPSAVQSKLNGPEDAFLTHIDPKSPNFLYSTYFGGSGHEIAEAIAVDAQGAIYIGGATDSTDFPVTAGALQTVYGGGTDVFLAKFAGTTPARVYATYWGGANGDLLQALTADSAGDAYAVAVTSQEPINLGAGIVVDNPQATLMKIDPTGARALWSNSNSALWGAQAIAVDSQGRVSALGLGGVSPVLTPNALSTCPEPGSSFFLQLEGDGKTVSYASGAPGNAFAMDSSGSVYFAGGTLIEKQDFSQDPPMAATCILGTTEYWSDAVAPGEIISIYGRNIGPAKGVVGVLDSTQRLPFTLGGVSVTFNGALAPLLYAQAGQINAIVPFEVVGQTSATLQITSSGSAAPPVRVPLRGASNIVIPTPGNPDLIAAINQDGTINSYAHPAAPGSIVTIFSSGGGQTNPPSVDGQIATSAANLVLPVQVLMGFNGPPGPAPPTPISADVLYAGAAPGLLAGTVQINFRISLNLPASDIGAGYPNQDIAIVIGNQSGYSTSGAIFVQ